MNKIIAAALSAKFPNSDIPTLLEIVGATGNPVVATEMLLGIYQNPSIPKSVRLRGKVHTFISYDKWANSVISSYPSTRSRHNYFETEEEANSATEWDPSRHQYSGDSLPYKRVFDVAYDATDSNSLETWMGSEVIE